MTEKLTPREARQGERGMPVLKILIVALVLAMIAWAVSGMFGEATDPENPVGETTTEQDATGETGPTQAPTVQ
ncbi:hypothetical protein [Rhizobium sp. EC-SD404]|uniref:hypothetical protein n=1 Tax=Rhizobium sp. EC-SD404 TaxID=2038389 RepID=UPI0012529C99|nr:hypothetical protein [Rhizobium sp. EC-SD404]VVT30970.1 conserved hypothetical protein [Rhizobium sp. EC-SD404]